MVHVMKKLCFLIVLICLFFPALGYSGTTYYVDPTASGGGNGSYAHPWNNIAQVNAHRFSTGDDVYFKAGSKLEMTNKLTINWDGSASDRVIIGAYSGDRIFALGGEERPILRGSYRRGGVKVPSSDYDALIHCNYKGAEFITVRDLALLESYSGGISFGARTSMSNIEVNNCVVKDSGRQGIVFAATKNSLIENCYVEKVCQRKISVKGGKERNSGAAIVLIGGGSETLSMYNTIRGCTVTKAFEGIGVYRSSRYALVEKNFVYDVVEISIYVNNARNATIRNNLVYMPGKTWQPQKDLHNLIQLDSEGHIKEILKLAGEHEVYGNYLAGGRYGILLASRSNKLGVHQKNNKVYNNRIVDCQYNIGLSKANKESMVDVFGWKNNQIYDNYSFAYSTGTGHTNVRTWPGVTWDGNFFNSAVEGDAANNAIINKVELKNKSGWRSLAAGILDASRFELTSSASAGSPPAATNLRIVSVK